MKLINKINKQYLLLIIIATFVVFVSACSSGDGDNEVSHPVVTELKIIDNLIGEGKKVKNNHRVAVHYTGWIYDDAAENKKGKKFDSSHDRSRPLVFSIGNQDVIAGWEQGIMGMKVGGKRTLIIPPSLGYGARGAGSSIPPNAALVFDVELLQAG